MDLIRKYVNDETYNILVQVLEYRNALLFDVPVLRIHRLQRVQKRVVSLVTGTRERDYTYPILFQLHWLDIRYRSLNMILF